MLFRQTDDGFELVSPEEEEAFTLNPDNMVSFVAGVGRVMIPDDEATEMRSFIPEPVVIDPVPASSAKLVLDDDGIYEQVESICLNHPVAAVRIYWMSAINWDFNNAFVQAIGTEMNLSDEQMLDMFARARLKA